MIIATSASAPSYRAAATRMERNLRGAGCGLVGAHSEKLRL